MLDTKDFTLRVGSRTFDAASYLRSLKADTVAVRKLFAGTAEENVRISITDTSQGLGNPTDEDGATQHSIININICQSICRLLHGRIWQDAEYTGGIRYILEIPKSITDNIKNTDC